MTALADLGRDLAGQLAALLGRNRVADHTRVAEYAIGPFAPMAVARPTEAAEVATALEWAHRNDVAVYPAGGRTLSQLGNTPTRPGIALDLTGLNRIVDFQPADLTVRVQAGITVGELDAQLGREGKCVPLNPPLANRATVGGTLASGISGPMRAAYGLPRDWLIGVSVVGADGAVSKAGGQVVKNVTGYDLNRLYAGSLGTLAVITEATFKITPAPTAWAAVIAAFADNQAAITAARNLWSKPFAPQSLHILTGGAARRVTNEYGLEGSGPVVIALIAGRPASVNRRAESATLAWLDAAGTLRLADQEAVSLAEALADISVNPANPPSLCVRINAPPGTLEQLLAMDNLDIGGSNPGIAADIGFGGGRLLWWHNLTDEKPAAIAERLRGVQAAAAGFGGSAIIESCPQAAKELIDVWGAPPSGMEIMRRIKHQFDPTGVLNSGRFIGGL